MTRPEPTTTGPLRRCCRAHGDWATLAEHLVAEFSEVTTHDVLQEVVRAKTAVDAVGLRADEAITVGELIARHQLLLLSGRAVDGARLDPETHHGRAS